MCQFELSIWEWAHWTLELSFCISFTREDLYEWTCMWMYIFIYTERNLCSSLRLYIQHTWTYTCTGNKPSLKRAFTLSHHVPANNIMMMSVSLRHYFFVIACMCACAYVRVYVCVSVCALLIYTHTYTYLHTHIYIHIWYLYWYERVHTHTQTNKHTHIYTCVWHKSTANLMSIRDFIKRIKPKMNLYHERNIR